MNFWNIFNKLKRKNEPKISISPETIESLPEVDDATFYSESKKLLQRFDEFITASEAECEILSIELDNILSMQEELKSKLQLLNKPNSWHERHLLLKLDRLQLHSDNLKQQIEIYSQNINIYLNLISKIQDIKAMRMNGLDKEKIETIWVEFKETFEEYKYRVSAEESGFKNEKVTSTIVEDRLKTIRKELQLNDDITTDESNKHDESEIKKSKHDNERLILE